MARPKTVKSTYQMVTFRMPPELRAYVQRRVEESGAPFNTELIKIMLMGIEAKDKACITVEDPPTLLGTAPVGG